MKGVHFTSGGRTGLQPYQLDEILALHRSFGLALGFRADDAVQVTYDGLSGAMVTELLRLAAIGQRAVERLAGPPGYDCADLVDEADVAWKARFR